jgi:hypothetical protein
MKVSSGTIKALRDTFVGKICTIFTPPINRDFDEDQSRDHFVVEIADITLDGIWTIHPISRTVSFFSLDAVMLIQEEVVLDPTNPVDQKAIESYEKKMGTKVVSDLGSHQMEMPETQQDVGLNFVDIKKIQSLARQTKENYDRMAFFEKALPPRQ